MGCDGQGNELRDTPRPRRRQRVLMLYLGVDAQDLSRRSQATARARAPRSPSRRARHGADLDDAGPRLDPPGPRSRPWPLSLDSCPRRSFFVASRVLKLLWVWAW